MKKPCWGLCLLLLTYQVTFAASPHKNTISVSRDTYQEHIVGFWLGQNIANWTGLITEMDRVEAPFYTRNDWQQKDSKNIWGNYVDHASTIDFFIAPPNTAWGSDDDTDIEYMYQYLLESHPNLFPAGEDIRATWLRHIIPEEEAIDSENFLWVSNEHAYKLMQKGVIPPKTGHPKSNPYCHKIDAQLSTEIFGVFSPGRPDTALKMARLPIATTACKEAAEIARFYVVMHSLAFSKNRTLKIHKRIESIALEASKQLSPQGYASKMFNFVYSQYKNTQNTWEETRDNVYKRYQLNTHDGYHYEESFDAGINFAASLVSLFYGEGDFKETLKIAALAGWDSDNPAATWGGFLGLMHGRAHISQLFLSQGMSDLYSIHRTRRNFPDRTPEQEGEDHFDQMASRGTAIVDRVIKYNHGSLNKRGQWVIPLDQ